MINDIKITLLTDEEYRQYKKIIPFIEQSWWLRSPGINSINANYVDWNGILYDSRYVNDPLEIRPALRMQLSNPKSLGPGDHIRIGSKSFIVLSWEENELFALCDEMIASRRFDPYNNEWKSSELRQWLETEGLKLIF